MFWVLVNFPIMQSAPVAGEDALRSWLGSRDRHAGGSTNARGRPRRRLARRDGGVSCSEPARLSWGLIFKIGNFPRACAFRPCVHREDDGYETAKCPRRTIQ